MQPKREPEDVKLPRSREGLIKGKATPKKVDSEPETKDPEPEIAREPSEATSTPHSKPVTLPRQSGRQTRPPERYGAPVGARDEAASLAHGLRTKYALTAALEEAPKSFKEAMLQPDAHLWLKAMIKELDSIGQHGVWKQVDCPTDQNVVACLWVFSYKQGPDGEIVRYKARLVAKGYLQRPGVNFGEISSPVATSDAY
ncbi:hypothetical protein RSOLAG1IB_11275 [Rhizoctonia solani AG-1 IB]|uniref:Reverse transcriptase Ty1/copia-type domain-containing protein n=1 Tax=Thanatephorus cucumeris (strain AG1-IB / isolate 7/3/14) TaxID=1108050 RepID=A0A0B7FAD3_THACB|nr:hypothetical protein RSOLAG1IB_11275 [Rhizoctonia solani AG-1 IB]